jgi:hypothetical protein
VSWATGTGSITGLMFGGPAPPEWARHAINAVEARLWQVLGVQPAEAARLARAGHAPLALIEAWWRAGIPLDEVAAWLGAGLTAAEAVEQRDAGVSVEDAAALRALQRMGRTD